MPRYVAFLRGVSPVNAVPHPKGAIFMGLIERTFGTALTTRSWDTIVKAAR